MTPPSLDSVMPAVLAADRTGLRAQAEVALRALVGREDAELREDQWLAVEALVADRRRALVVQRTGWGKSAVYFVATALLRAGAAADAQALQAWINERVGARYQRVSRVLVYAEFPRNAAGKILKREMRDPFWVGREMKI